MTAPSPGHELAAPFVARVLLAVGDSDEAAFLQALNDAASEGVDPASLLVVVSQALLVHMDRANPGWRAHLRASLLDLAA